MLDSINLTLKLHFWCENAKILSLCRHCYYGHNITKYVNHSGLSILMHGIISLLDMTS